MHGEAVVEAHLGQIARGADRDADMGKAVELGTDLADFGRQKLVIVHQLRRTEWTAGRRAGDAHREFARAEQRHFRHILMADFHGLALFGDRERSLDHFRLGVPVGGAGLVAFAPNRVWPPFDAERRFHRVAIDPGLTGALFPVAVRTTGKSSAGNQRQPRAKGRMAYPSSKRHGQFSCWDFVSAFDRRDVPDGSF